MKYTLPGKNQPQYRTTDYVGTTEDYRTDPDVESLKLSVRNNNAHIREASRKYGRICGTLLRVRIKARGPRLAGDYHTRIENATHYDIYQGEDSHAMYQLNREITTGLTPSELHKYDLAKDKIRWLEMIGNKRLRGEEIHQWLLDRI